MITETRKELKRRKNCKAVRIAVAMTMFMVLSSWHCHCKKAAISSHECGTVSGSRQPLDQADWLQAQIHLNWQL